jgi:3-ketoacyl-CoA synthase
MFPLSAASPVSIELAQQALALRPGSYVLVVSTEVVTQSIYKGTQRSMQVANVLFRCAEDAASRPNRKPQTQMCNMHSDVAAAAVHCTSAAVLLDQ